jgi:hypothetical protein
MRRVPYRWRRRRYYFAVGTLAVGAPIWTSFGAITAAFAALRGKRLSGRPEAGLLVTVLGACVVAVPGPGHRRVAHASSGLGWALGAELGSEVGFWSGSIRRADARRRHPRVHVLRDWCRGTWGNKSRCRIEASDAERQSARFGSHH